MLVYETIVSVGVLVALLVFITACVCGCRNSNQKSELVGMHGVVKLNLDEDIVPTPTATTPTSSIKRTSGQNSQRSLPEIPNSVVRHDSGDTTSEIYATLNLHEGEKEKKKDHPYEHAYAKLQNENDVRIEVIEEQLAGTSTEPPSNSQQINGTTTPPESVLISASVAISGQMPSSQELPYITPPSVNRNTAVHLMDNVQHFSGDSTESTKGYTSISVREPLSNIMAATKLKSQAHYATVSDDSDEMYAAIDDPSVGGSDTYAQIQMAEDEEVQTSINNNVTSISNMNTTIVQAEVNTVLHDVIVPSHSPQASASSGGNNSLVNIGSPKPEKRQANSPLPPTPQSSNKTASNNTINSTDTKIIRTQEVQARNSRISSTGDLHLNPDKNRRSLNEKHQRNHSCVSSSDFYGCNYPVDKHRYSSGDLIRPLVAKELNFDIDNPLDKEKDNIYNDIEATASDLSDSNRLESLPRNVDDMYAKVMKKKNFAVKADITLHLPNNALSPEDPEYETIGKRNSIHGYEKIHKVKRKSSENPGYETVSELFQSENTNQIIPTTNGGSHVYEDCSSECSSEPNYEVLTSHNQIPTYAVIPADYNKPEVPGYSVINKKKYWNNDILSEPNYESMPHDSIYNTGSESDPNYESVTPKLADYESIRQDPNYESLRSKHSNYETLNAKEPSYANVKKETSLGKDTAYEHVNEHSTTNDENKVYESIKHVEGKLDSENVSDYYQV